MKLFYVTFLILFFLISFSCFSQNVGIGTTTPSVKFHVVNGTAGPMGHPYETAVIESINDHKFGVYCSNPNPINIAAASIALGYTGITDVNSNYLGFEMQYGQWTAGKFLRFNALVRNAAGTVVTGGATPSYQNVLVLDNNGRVGINLTNGVNAPVSPTANLHVNGTIRFENLMTSPGFYLVVDANGNVFKSAAMSMNTPVSNNNSSNSIEIEELKSEVAILKAQVGQLLTVINQKNGSIYENSTK